MSRKSKLLLVEDDQPTIDIYKTAFSRADFSLDVAQTGKDALDYFEKSAKKNDFPAAVLLDIILPDISGIDVLAQIKNLKDSAKFPVFITSNYSDPEMEKRARLLGAEEFFIKANFTPSELVEKIKKIIAVKQVI